MWNPWNWVKGGWDFAFSGIKQLYQWVLTTIAQVYDYVNGLVQWLEDQINQAFQYALNLAISIEKWGQSWYDWIISWARSTFDQITRWVTGLWNQLWGYIQDAWNFAHWVYSYLYNLVSGWINDVYKWVERNIWDPLYNWVTGIYKELSSYISYLLQFIQHPELLANLIAGYLIKFWLALVRKYAVTLARWWMRVMMSLVGEFTDILESILSAIL